MVETRVKEELVSALLSRGVDYHCRRKLRPGCDCDYCSHKRRTWVRFTASHILGSKAYYEPHVPRYHQMSYDRFVEIEGLLHEGRKLAAKRLRKELNQIRNE
jgi:hypothetical protein